MKQKAASRLPWIVVAILSLGLAFSLALTFVPRLNAFALGLATGTTSRSTDTRSITSLALEEQVVLMSLGVQGIKEQSEALNLFGMKVPGSSRTTFLQYDFSAKVGFTGEEVAITETGENTFNVSIPKFIFIGHDDVAFKLITEDNGVLSMVTPEVDTINMTNEILNDVTEAEYIKKNTEILRHQAETYFTSVIANIDPEVSLTFTFTD